MKNSAVHGIAPLGVTAIGMFVLSAAGCGASASSICDAICDCQPCANDQYDDCVDDFEDAFQKAERQGCSDKADAYLQCLDTNLQCVDERVDVSSCDIEGNGFAACAKDVPHFDSACGQGAQRLQECLGALVDPSKVRDCTGSTRCTLNCYADASCEALQFGDSPELNSCLASCPVDEPPPPPVDEPPPPPVP
jgi:hypothetical protein